MATPLIIGDRVEYKAAFCRSVGDYTCLPHLKGSVTDLTSPTQDWVLATVEWDRKTLDIAGLDEGIGRVNVGNLKRLSDYEPN